MRLLLENVLRNGTGSEGEAAKAAILGWLASGASEAEIAFVPGRVLMHDTTCVPALVDVAAMRSALAEAGGDPTLLNPVLAVDVSVDHSVAVDHYGSPDALQRNMERELGRNLERYRFMKWATRALKDLRVHPPGTGIMHTINLERLATIVTTETRDGESWAVPDTLIGTDSHTPMINGIGVLAWGVGGVEAESVLFGMPVMLRIPEVIGVRLSGRLPDGTLATDLALTVTEQLRRLGLSGQFVEFFGPGLSSLSAGDRAVVANMAPEYGASSGFFPVDEQTLAYLVATGRSRSQADLVAAYAKRQSLWFDPDATPRYTDTIEIDLGRIGVTLAGPRRPQDRLSPAQTVAALAGLWDVPLRPAGPDATEPPDGAVAIAAITSCTNTSNPRHDGRRRAARPQGAAPRPHAEALGEDLASLPALPPPSAICGARGSSRISRRSASASSATAARPASAIRVRSRRRWGRPSRSAASMGWPFSPETVTSPAACTRRSRPDSWPRPRSRSRTRSPATSIATS